MQAASFVRTWISPRMVTFAHFLLTRYIVVLVGSARVTANLAAFSYRTIEVENKQSYDVYSNFGAMRHVKIAHFY